MHSLTETRHPSARRRFKSSPLPENQWKMQVACAGRPWRSRMSSTSVAACTAWMDTTRPARRLRGAGGHDAVEGAELRRARRCMGAREVEPDFAHEFVGGGLGGRPRSRLLAGRARLDAPGMEPGSDTHVGCRGEALARCRVLGRCERGVEQGDTALPYGGCDFWAVRHVAQVAVHVDEAIAPPGAHPRRKDLRSRALGRSVRPPARLARSGPHALPPLRPASFPFCAASCMASAALVSSSAPTPESYRRTSPASICPIMVFL